MDNFSLKPIDIEFMRRLHTKVNLIPVIAKADTLTDDEVMLFKRRVSGLLWHVKQKSNCGCPCQVLADISYLGISTFQPQQYENEDEETVQENKEIIVRISLVSNEVFWLIRERSRARFLLPLSGQTLSSSFPMADRSAAVLTHGVSLK